jgi:hypothetical protein
MSDGTVSFERFTADQKTQSKSLTSAPRLAWPTVTMWVGLNVAFLCSHYFGGTGQIPLWVGMVINSAVGYIAFSSWQLQTVGFCPREPLRGRDFRSSSLWLLHPEASGSGYDGGGGHAAGWGVRADAYRWKKIYAGLQPN